MPTQESTLHVLAAKTASPVIKEPRNKRKIQFLSHRNAVNAKDVMLNLLRRKVFVGVDRYAVLQNLWESEQHTRGSSASSDGKDYTQKCVHSDSAAAAAADERERIRVLLIGFEDSQVRHSPQAASEARLIDDS